MKSGAFFNSTKKEPNNFFCGIGKSEIHESKILIADYPFEPSIAYSQKSFSSKEITAICVEFGVCRIYVRGDIVFISAEKKEDLKKFAERNYIKLIEKSWVWDWILEPYLDTELSSDMEKQIANRLEEKGFESSEVDEIRNEVGKQMYKYNFDTMLWEWCSLGLLDVLSAMRVKYDQEKFKEFYKRALTIDMRGNEFP